MPANFEVRTSSCESQFITGVVTAGVGIGIEALTRTAGESYGIAGSVATGALSILGANLFSIYLLPKIGRRMTPFPVTTDCEKGLIKGIRINTILAATIFSGAAVTMGAATNTTRDELNLILKGL